MRYFLVTFSLSDKFSLGTICFESNGFFSYEELLSQVQKQYPYAKGIVVVSIYEFSDINDFTKYKGEAEETSLGQYAMNARRYAMQAYGWGEAQVEFIDGKSVVAYFLKNVPVSEAVKDIILSRLT